jgi:hypothetical protein
MRVATSAAAGEAVAVARALRPSAFPDGPRGSPANLAGFGHPSALNLVLAVGRAGHAGGRAAGPHAGDGRRAGAALHLQDGRRAGTDPADRDVRSIRQAITAISSASRASPWTCRLWDGRDGEEGRTALAPLVPRRGSWAARLGRDGAPRRPWPSRARLRRRSSSRRLLASRACDALGHLARQCPHQPVPGAPHRDRGRGRGLRRRALHLRPAFLQTASTAGWAPTASASAHAHEHQFSQRQRGGEANRFKTHSRAFRILG